MKLRLSTTKWKPRSERKSYNMTHIFEESFLFIKFLGGRRVHDYIPFLSSKLKQFFAGDSASIIVERYKMLTFITIRHSEASKIFFSFTLIFSILGLI